MLGLGLNKKSKAPGGIAYQPGAKAFFSALPTQPEKRVKNAYNNIWKNRASLMSEVDIFYWCLAQYEDNKRTTLANPSLYYEGKVGSPVFEQFGGVKGAVSSAYNSGFTPSTDAVNYQLNNASFFAYNATPALISNFLRLAGCSVAGEAGSVGLYFTNSPSVGGSINTYNEINTGVSSVGRYGLWHLVKIGSTITVYYNGVQLGSPYTVPSVALPNCPFYGLAQNLGGTLDSPYVNGKVFSYGLAKGTIDPVDLYELHKEMIGDLPLWKFYGDSIFAGYLFSNPATESIPYHLSVLGGQYALNFAISGTTVKDLVDSKIHIERTNNSDGIVAFDYIVNDVDQAIGTSVYGSNYRTVIESAIAGGAKKVLMVIPYITDTAITNNWGPYITEAQTVASEYDEVQLIDLRATPYTLSDGTHPTTGGAIQAAGLIYAQL